LNKLATNCNLDDLPWCQVVSKAYSTSKEYCSRGHTFLNIDSQVFL